MRITSEIIRAVYGHLVSISLPCQNVSALDFLGSAQGQARFYWRHGDTTLAGVGKAVEITALGDEQITDIRAQIQTLFENATIQADNVLARPHLFGGLAFFEDFVPDHIWSIYFPAHFVLPHYQFLRIGNQQWLTINVQLPEHEIDASTLDELREALCTKITELQTQKPNLPSVPNRVLNIHYPMSFETWSEKIQAVLARIQQGEVEKVVLARVGEIQFENPPDLLATLRYLGQAYPECYRFLFEPRAQFAMLGATPELLIEVQARNFKTMGLAGSIQRGKTPAEDENFAQDLLKSAKNRHEHQLVVDSIAETLKPKTDELHIGETDILSLKNIQHLHTPLAGKLKAEVDILDLLQALHPTPALGGKPRQIALEMIRHLESIPRGWYAAPIGWLDGDFNGQFAIGIRSGVVQEKRAWLYAGVGLVEGSQADQEWQETELKFRPMLNALTHHES